MDRTRALLFSLALAVVLNMMAGVVTLLYANGSTITESNPSSAALLQELGAVSLLVRALEIATLYSLAYLLSRAISSGRRIFRVKRIYLFTFSLLIAILPAGAFADFLNDVLVVFIASNALAGSDRMVLFALACAIPFAVLQVKRRWTLQLPA